MFDFVVGPYYNKNNERDIFRKDTKMPEDKKLKSAYNTLGEITKENPELADRVSSELTKAKAVVDKRNPQPEATQKTPSSRTETVSLNDAYNTLGEITKENPELTKAREIVDERSKAKFIESFERGEQKQTDLLRKRLNGGARFYYGVPVLNDGKLTGFKMMTFLKAHTEIGSMRSSDEPLKNDDGQQVFYNVDEYWQFEKKLKNEDTRLGTTLEKIQKAAEVKEVQKEIKKEHKPFNKFLEFFERKKNRRKY